MKEVLKVLLFLCAASWVCSLPGFECAPALASPAAAPPPPPPPKAPVKFTTDKATRKSYKQFIEELRDHVAPGTSHGIQVLPDPATLADANRYTVVYLSNSDTESIQIGLDLTNAYVIAYRARLESYFLRDAPDSAQRYLFVGTRMYTLPFGGTYRDLAYWGGRSREETYLGLEALRGAISVLWRGVDDNGERARALVVIIQMVSEAARFRHVSSRVGQSIGDGNSFQPHTSLVTLQNEWGSLSENVQRSQSETFPHAVTLMNYNNQHFLVTSTTHPVIRGLALMLFFCRPPPGPKQSPVVAPPMITSFIRSIVEKPPKTCDVYEPTVRISGRDGKCVDVSNSDYSNGNSIILWKCGGQLQDNQLWTLKRDKTIRSKGKCLTTYGYAQGNYIMIYDCQSAVREATQWEIWDNGTIYHPRSNLALTAQSSVKGGTLTLQKNEYYMRQGWRTSNDTSPFVTAISGYNGLCMEAHGNNVWLGKCDSSKKDQLWAVFSDGSIRTARNTNNCLTSKDHKLGATIVIMACSPGWASQRWLFKDDGTIYSLYDKMVMDVKSSDPSLKQIILYPYTGNDNQIWLALL